MVDFRALETFLWVATLKSFSATAAKLNTTQPAISQRIAALEREIGHQLLDRSVRILTPTPVGRRVLDHAETLIRARAEMMAELISPATVQGNLSLGVAETIVHTWLPKFLERMGRTYPHLDVEIEVDVSEKLRERLLSQDIDLAFMLGPVVNPYLNTCALNRYPLAFIAARTLALSDRMVDLPEIVRHPILTYARNSTPHVAVRERFMRLGFPKVRIRASSSLGTTIRMTLDGLGIAAIPPTVVTQEIADGHLCKLEVPVELPQLEFAAAWRSGPDTFLLQAAAKVAADVAESFVS